MRLRVTRVINELASAVPVVALKQPDDAAEAGMEIDEVTRGSYRGTREAEEELKAGGEISAASFGSSAGAGGAGSKAREKQDEEHISGTGF